MDVSVLCIIDATDIYIQGFSETVQHSEGDRGHVEAEKTIATWSTHFAAERKRLQEREDDQIARRKGKGDGSTLEDLNERLGESVAYLPVGVLGWPLEGYDNKRRLGLVIKNQKISSYLLSNHNTMRVYHSTQSSICYNQFS